MKNKLKFAMVMLCVGFILSLLSPHQVTHAQDVCDTVTQIPTTECDALRSFYNGTGGGNWINDNGWLNTNTPCSWYGVTCVSGHVWGLNLEGNSLNGSIPTVLTDLPNLEEVVLSGNTLKNSIPKDIGNLDNLRRLDLDDNQLSGTIPIELGNLEKLTRLTLEKNGLKGEIPLELINLVALTSLTLNYNMLTVDENNTALVQFLTQKAGTWENTQTVAPTDLQATTISKNQIQLDWTPIPYTANSGYYEISVKSKSDSQTVRTNNKSASTITVSGLETGTEYAFKIRTFTPATSGIHQVGLLSDESSEVKQTTTPVGPSTVSIEGPTTGVVGFGNVGPTYVYTASVTPSDTSIPSLKYSWDPKPKSTKNNTATYQWSESGSQVITVTATNDGGEKSQSYTVQVAPAIPPTEATLDGPTLATVNTSYNFSTDITPADATILQITWNPKPATGQGTTDVTYRWQNTAGDKVISMVAENGGGRVEISQTVRVVVPPSSVNITGPVGGLRNTPYTFTASVKPDLTNVTPISYTWIPEPVGGAGTGVVTYSWAITGTPKITVVAYNEYGRVTDTHQIAIAGLPNSTPTPTPTTTPTTTPTPTSTPTSSATDEPTAEPTETIVPTMTPTATPVPGTGIISPDNIGEVNSADGSVTVFFPRGAVTQTIVVSITTSITTPRPLPQTIHFANRAFEIVAVNLDGEPVTTFEKPIVLQLLYSDSDWMSADVREETLRVYWWNSETWESVCDDCKPDMVQKLFTISLNHLSEFAFFGRQWQSIYIPIIMREQN